MKNKTIVITGGHHNSALVVAQALQLKNCHVIWFGHRFAARGDLHDSAEYQEVTGAGLEFYELKAGKMSAEPQWSEIINIPLGILRALLRLSKIRPHAVLSFGGYIGLATTLAAFVLKIPVYIHEQTIVPGKANRIAAKYARKIYLTWNSSARYFLTPKAYITGLPLRLNLLRAKPQQLFDNTRKTLLILGGKQGSYRINEAIFRALPQLTKKYNIIHQTGTNSITNDYVHALEFRSKVYKPYGYIGEDDLGKYLASASLVISRAGAHTAYELGVLGKRALLIPLLATTGQEQLRQAELLQAAGIVSIILESELTTKKLLTDITHALTLEEAVPLSLPTDATTRLVTNLLSDLS